MRREKTYKMLDFGKLAIAAKGNVYGPGNVKVPESLYDELQARLEVLREKRNSSNQEDVESEVENFGNFSSEATEPEISEENEEPEDVEEEIPTVDELIKKNRKYLEDKAEQLNIPDPSSFQSKAKLAAAIVDALQNPDEELEEEDEEEELEEEE